MSSVAEVRNVLRSVSNLPVHPAAADDAKNITSKTQNHSISKRLDEYVQRSANSLPKKATSTARQNKKRETESEYIVALEENTTIEGKIENYDHDRRLFFIVLNALNILTMVILGVILYILVKYLEGFSLQPDRAELSDYNVHLVCTVFGFVISPAYAMLLYRIFPHMKQSTLTVIHVGFLMFTSFISIFGIKVAYESHHVYGVVHLYSLHGWLGVGITTLLFFCIVSGNWIYLSPTQLPFMTSCHKIAGMTMFIVACAASISGLLTRSQHLIRRSAIGTASQSLPSRVIILNSLGLMITLFGILSRFLLSNHRFRRRPRPGTITNDEGLSTSLFRYLATTTTDSSLILPDVPERYWTMETNLEPDMVELEPDSVNLSSLESEVAQKT